MDTHLNPSNSLVCGRIFQTFIAYLAHSKIHEKAENGILINFKNMKFSVDLKKFYVFESQNTFGFYFKETRLWDHIANVNESDTLI